MCMIIVKGKVVHYAASPLCADLWCRANKITDYKVVELALPQKGEKK